MGIKGIYGEIGPGDRVAFSKLAIEKLEKTGRPLRVAIDVSIWQFQTQAGQGGTNPAIRTFYYRLLRLLSISVQPIFIFDGPHKPPFKRNKKSGHHGVSVPNMLTKQMLKLFGYPFYQAPGEAEAECALLQREGIVDAVLSEDVDTLMFGCGMTLRNWSSEGSRGNKAPTHVSVYEAKTTKEGASGLDREGMILVALMSGGDYITEGIPGCGIKLACQAARAGFGHSLCKISRNDVAGLDVWRKNLAHEIQTNESKYFRTKHKALNIPHSFPNREVLGYYTHPVVSSTSKIEKLKDEIIWDGEVDVQGLRLFVSEAFEWTNKIGAKKFIRGLAPVLLVYKLRIRGDRRDSSYGDLVLTAMNEMELVRAIGGNRHHFSTDGLRELRLVYMPIDIVGINLEEEYDDSGDYGRDGLAPLSDDDQVEGYVSDDAGGRSASATNRAPSQYDPEKLDKVWISATIARIGVPLKVEDYEEALKDPIKSTKAKSAAKKATAQGGMPKGALDRFVKVSKPGVGDGHGVVSKPLTNNSQNREESLPPVYLAPSLGNLSLSQSLPKPTSNKEASSTRSSTRLSIESPPFKPTKTAKPKTKIKASKKENGIIHANPWTLVSSSQPSPKPTTKITKPTAAKPKSSSLTQFKYAEWIVDSSPPPRPIPSSPPPVTKSQAPKRRHSPSTSSSRSRPSSPVIDPDSFTKPQQTSPDLHEELSLPKSVAISRRRSKKYPTPQLEPPNTPSRSRISRSEDRPSPRKKVSAPCIDLQKESRRESVPLPLGLGLENTTGKFDFSGEISGNARVSSLRFNNSDDGDAGRNERPGTRPPCSKVQLAEVIDLCSSPPVPRSLPLHGPRSPPSSQLRSSLQTQSSPPPPVVTTIPTKLTSAEDEDDNVLTPELKTSSRSRSKRGRGKEYIRIRQSIGGGVWKDVDEDDILRRDGNGDGQGRRSTEGVWRKSAIEVLDLSGDAD